MTDRLRKFLLGGTLAPPPSKFDPERCPRFAYYAVYGDGPTLHILVRSRSLGHIGNFIHGSCQSSTTREQIVRANARIDPRVNYSSCPSFWPYSKKLPLSSSEFTRGDGTWDRRPRTRRAEHSPDSSTLHWVSAYEETDRIINRATGWQKAVASAYRARLRELIPSSNYDMATHREEELSSFVYAASRGPLRSSRSPVGKTCASSISRPRSSARP